MFGRKITRPVISNRSSFCRAPLLCMKGQNSVQSSVARLLSVLLREMTIVLRAFAEKKTIVLQETFRALAVKMTIALQGVPHALAMKTKFSARRCTNYHLLGVLITNSTHCHPPRFCPSCSCDDASTFLRQPTQVLSKKARFIVQSQPKSHQRRQVPTSPARSLLTRQEVLILRISHV